MLRKILKAQISSMIFPGLINFDAVCPHIVESPDGSWGWELLIYGKINIIRATPVRVGLLASDWYSFEDELTINNEDILNIPAAYYSNGGFGFSLRGLTIYDEYYFRPYAVYDIGGQEVVIYGSIMFNELMYLNIVNMPMTLELTDEDYAEIGKPAFSLSEWIKTEGYDKAGITTYYVEE